MKSLLGGNYGGGSISQIWHFGDLSDGICIPVSSRPREPPPQPLTEPDVNLSVHPALIVRLARKRHANVQTNSADDI